MTKKNIRPQQVAPVKRETTATSSPSREGGVVAHIWPGPTETYPYPFAGDDAE